MLRPGLNTDVKQLVAPQSITATGVAGVAVETTDYKGVAALVLNHAGITDTDSTASPTATFKLQECATTGGTFTDVDTSYAWTAVSSATDAAETLEVDLSKCSKYIKAYCTIADEANATVVAGITGLFEKAGF